MAVYAYAPDETDFTTAGLVGELTASSCQHEQIAGGMSEITIEHPIDEMGRWKCLRERYILKAPTPVRTTPAFSEGGIVTSVEKWMVKTTAAKADRVLYYDSACSRKRALLPAGLEVTVMGRDGSSVSTVRSGQYGEGYVKSSALEFIEEDVLPEDPAAIEEVEGAWSVRDQLFRIYKVEKTERLITAWAKHISYDLAENITMYSASSATAREAIEGVLEGCLCPHPFAAYTNSANERTGLDYARQNAVWALLDQDEGIAARYGLECVRDDFSFYFLTRAGMDRGVRIEYGKNLRGVSCEIDESEVYTRIVPVGTGADGRALLLEGDEPWVESELADDYPTPKMYVLQCSSDCKETAEVNAATVRERMRAEAQSLIDNGCDRPDVSLRVDFISLGDTVEYARYKSLEQVYLFDSVTVYVAPLGIDMQLQVTRTVFDCLRLRYDEVELGTARKISVGPSPSQFNNLVRKTGVKSLSPGETMYSEVQSGLVAQEVGKAGEILRQAGISIGVDGVIVYADDNANMWQSKLNTQADRISLVVEGSGANASVKAASIVAAINQSGSTVTISADKILLNGTTSVDDLLTGNAIVSWLRATQLDANNLSAVDLYTESLTVGENTASWMSQIVCTMIDWTTGTDPAIGQVITSITRTRKTLYYLGRTNT